MKMSEIRVEETQITRARSTKSPRSETPGYGWPAGGPERRVRKTNCAAPRDRRRSRTWSAASSVTSIRAVPRPRREGSAGPSRDAPECAVAEQREGEGERNVGGSRVELHRDRDRDHDQTAGTPAASEGAAQAPVVGSRVWSAAPMTASQASRVAGRRRGGPPPLVSSDHPRTREPDHRPPPLVPRLRPRPERDRGTRPRDDRISQQRRQAAGVADAPGPATSGRAEGGSGPTSPVPPSRRSGEPRARGAGPGAGATRRGRSHSAATPTPGGGSGGRGGGVAGCGMRDAGHAESGPVEPRQPRDDGCRRRGGGGWAAPSRGRRPRCERLASPVGMGTGNTCEADPGHGARSEGVCQLLRSMHVDDRLAPDDGPPPPVAIAVEAVSVLTRRARILVRLHSPQPRPDPGASVRGPGASRERRPRMRCLRAGEDLGARRRDPSPLSSPRPRVPPPAPPRPRRPLAHRARTRLARGAARRGRAGPVPRAVRTLPRLGRAIDELGVTGRGSGMPDARASLLGPRPAVCWATSRRSPGVREPSGSEGTRLGGAGAAAQPNAAGRGGGDAGRPCRDRGPMCRFHGDPRGSGRREEEKKKKKKKKMVERERDEERGRTRRTSYRTSRARTRHERRVVSRGPASTAVDPPSAHALALLLPPRAHVPSQMPPMCPRDASPLPLPPHGGPWPRAPPRSGAGPDGRAARGEGGSSHRRPVIAFPPPADGLASRGDERRRRGAGHGARGMWAAAAADARCTTHDARCAMRDALAGGSPACGGEAGGRPWCAAAGRLAGNMELRTSHIAHRRARVLGPAEGECGGRSGRSGRSGPRSPGISRKGGSVRVAIGCLLGLVAGSSPGTVPRHIGRRRACGRGSRGIQDVATVPSAGKPRTSQGAERCWKSSSDQVHHRQNHHRQNHHRRIIIAGSSSSESPSSYQQPPQMTHTQSVHGSPWRVTRARDLSRQSPFPQSHRPQRASPLAPRPELRTDGKVSGIAQRPQVTPPPRASFRVWGGGLSVGGVRATAGPTSQGSQDQGDRLGSGKRGGGGTSRGRGKHNPHVRPTESRTSRPTLLPCPASRRGGPRRALAMDPARRSTRLRFPPNILPPNILLPRPARGGGAEYEMPASRIRHGRGRRRRTGGSDSQGTRQLHEHGNSASSVARRPWGAGALGRRAGLVPLGGLPSPPPP
ncbi:hypothetical protein JHW43_004264 [Diplocarpon mali]|nr:hypothetical protein JHW43_004264 [Diplocarpon mali]